METLNTGANAIHSMSNTVGPNSTFSGAISAQQYIGTATGATGIGLVVTSDKGFFNLTKYSQMDIANSGGNAAALGSTYLRLVTTFDLAGWDAGFGIQNWSGASSFTTDGTNLALIIPASGFTVGSGGVIQQTKASAIDGQIQGQIGDMPLGIYASYARAPATTGVINTYNGGTMTRSSFNIAAELGVLPGIATIGAAVRQGKSGVAELVTNANTTDNAVYLTATYKLQQNMMARLSYVSNTGSYWSQANDPANRANGTNKEVLGSKTTMMNMYVLF